MRRAWSAPNRGNAPTARSSGRSTDRSGSARPSAADKKPRPHADAPGQQGLPGADQGHADRKSPRAWLRRELAGAQVLQGEDGGAGEGCRLPGNLGQSRQDGADDNEMLQSDARRPMPWPNAGMDPVVWRRPDSLPGLGRQPYDSSGLILAQPRGFGAQSCGSAAEPQRSRGTAPPCVPPSVLRIARSQALTMPRL